MQSAFEAARASLSHRSLFRRSSLPARVGLSVQRRPLISLILPKLIPAEAIADPFIGSMGLPLVLSLSAAEFILPRAGFSNSLKGDHEVEL